MTSSDCPSCGQSVPASVADKINADYDALEAAESERDRLREAVEELANAAQAFVVMQAEVQVAREQGKQSLHDPIEVGGRLGDAIAEARSALSPPSAEEEG